MKAIDNSNHNNGFYESAAVLLFWTGFCTTGLPINSYSVISLVHQLEDVNANSWNCLNEQRRIVARVDQLMSLCDKLEATLLRSQADSEKLIWVVVGRMLAGGDSVEGDNNTAIAS